MSQISSSLQSGIDAAREQQMDGLYARLEQIEERMAEQAAQAERFNEVYESLAGATEDYQRTAGGVLERINETVGDGFKVLAGLMPSGTVVLCHQVNRNALRRAGWLICDGTDVSASDFPQLREILGDKYGVAGPGALRLPAPDQLTGVQALLDLIDAGDAAFVVRA